MLVCENYDKMVTFFCRHDRSTSATWPPFMTVTFLDLTDSCMMRNAKLSYKMYSNRYCEILQKNYGIKVLILAEDAYVQSDLVNI